MLHTTFGRGTGLRVSEYALGTANYATGPDAPAGPAEARAIFDAFAEAGGTFIDTSDRYQDGQSETVLADLLAADRDRFVLSTKYTRGSEGKYGISENGNGRKTMVRSLEASLRRLGTDYVDVYWAHLPDGVTPVEEIVATFDDLVRAGKILHGGLSNFPAWRVAAAATQAVVRDRAPVVGIQVAYNLADRTAERELLPMAEAFGLGAALYSPLAGAVLTGKFRQDGHGSRRPARPEDGHTSAVLDTVLDVADECGTNAAQVSVAWLRARAARSATALIPVIGPRTPAQLNAYLAALDLTLTDEQYERLDRVSAVALGTPHETVAAALPTIFGGEPGLMRRHPVPVV
ncbi:aryl-alcohol dehydrogenase-like predicted oxidoreductase [Streptomyces aurantiacus]|uniref:aldo/keto reductase n=1 Tax=Streptomyces aurantiacus TaxID=47760 RepID=UPI002794DE7B|nr:aldo/keto reductase [Streptomyces aurantiacus]MDQ0774747.1 aryl-alcohol dehydrogenase-like predicted oxidoreductase [Streptomyces aurantiacus]